MRRSPRMKWSRCWGAKRYRDSSPLQARRWSFPMPCSRSKSKPFLHSVISVFSFFFFFFSSHSPVLVLQELTCLVLLLLFIVHPRIVRASVENIIFLGSLLYIMSQSDRCSVAVVVHSPPLRVRNTIEARNDYCTYYLYVYVIMYLFRTHRANVATNDLRSTSKTLP